MAPSPDYRDAQLDAARRRRLEESGRRERAVVRAVVPTGRWRGEVRELELFLDLTDREDGMTVQIREAVPLVMQARARVGEHLTVILGDHGDGAMVDWSA